MVYKKCQHFPEQEVLQHFDCWYQGVLLPEECNIPRGLFARFACSYIWYIYIGKRNNLQRGNGNLTVMGDYSSRSVVCVAA